MATVSLRPYVSDLAAEWLQDTPGAVHRRIEGSMAFVDISGFTSLTERLTRTGIVGSEELSDILSSTFAALLTETRREQADLVKWGGDAVLLLFRGHDHAVRAVRATMAMRRALYTVGKTRSSAGLVTLRMSVGVHSGLFDFFLVGNPRVHRELIVSGPAASRTAELEAAASAGQIAVSAETARLLPSYAVSPTPAGLLLVRRTPAARTETEEVARDGGYACDDEDGPGVALLLPPPVRSHLLAEAGEAEHRAISVAFVQFSGTDAMLESRGPEAVAGALDDLVRQTQSACESHGVTFLESDINRDGGKIMLVCGAPAPGEDVEDRMVRAVRRIIDGAGTLPLRAGINAGRVFSADFGPTFRRTYSVKGDAINVAARVMGKASPGQALATRNVLTRVGGGIVTEEVPPFRVKGKAHPIEAALVLATSARSASDDLPTSDELMLGRDAEVRTITALLARARAGRGQFIEVTAAAGLGKSVLIRRVIDEVGADFVTVRGPSRRFGGAVAHQAVRRMLRDVTGVHPSLAVTEQVSTLRAAVTAATPTLLPWLPLLAALLGGSVPETPEVRDLDQHFRPARAAEVLVEFLAGVCTTPTLFVFEGADSMDDSSVDLVRRIIADRTDRPWVIVTTRRTPEGGLVAAPADAPSRIALDPLRPDLAMSLLEAWTIDKPVSDHLLRSVVAKAGGNPLFLRSLLELALTRGTVADLPDTIEDVMGAEIGELPPRARTILRFASVLGESFGLDDLADLVRDEGWTVRPEDLHDLRGQLQLEGDRGGWYRFSSALIRDVAYSGLPYRLRRRLHLRAGESLEESGAEPVPLESLSTHFFEAGHHDKALGYSRQAAEQAQRAYSHMEALDLYRRALASAARARDVPEAVVGHLHEAIGDVAEMVGDSTDAIAEYRRARTWVRKDPCAASAVMAKEVGLHQRVGAFGTSLRVAVHARRELGGVEGPVADAVRSRLAVQMAFVHHLRGRHVKALSWSETAVAEALRCGDPGVLAKAYNSHALVLAVGGVTPDRPYGELALASSEESGDLLLQGKCLTNLAISAIIDGRWPVAEKLLDRAAVVVERVGDTTNVANVRYNRCDVLVRQGRWAEAEPLLAAVGRSANASGDLELVALVGRDLGKTRLGQGRPEAAMAHLEGARSRLGELGLDHEALDADVGLLGARIVSAQGPGEGAHLRMDLDALLVRARAAGLADLVARLHFLRGTSLLRGGQAAAALTAYETGAHAPPGEGGFERALNQVGVALAAEANGQTRGTERADAQETLARLGVCALPIPMAWGDPGAQTAPR